MCLYRFFAFLIKWTKNCSRWWKMKWKLWANECSKFLECQKKMKWDVIDRTLRQFKDIGRWLADGGARVFLVFPFCCLKLLKFNSSWLPEMSNWISKLLFFGKVSKYYCSHTVFYWGHERLILIQSDVHSWRQIIWCKKFFWLSLWRERDAVSQHTFIIQ